MDDLHILHAIYAEHLGFYMHSGYSVVDAISTAAVDFIDFANRTADFNNDQFIDMLNFAERRVYRGPGAELFGRWYVVDCLQDIKNAHAETFAFMIGSPLCGTHGQMMHLKPIRNCKWR